MTYLFFIYMTLCAVLGYKLAADHVSVWGLIFFVLGGLVTTQAAYFIGSMLGGYPWK